MSKIVIALGGNALGDNPEQQRELVKIPARKIVNLIKDGHEVVIGHGNGPQVGMIYNAFADAKKANDKTPIVPFAEAGGMSQGYIGYHLQTAIANELRKENINKDVLYILTQTIVDKNDPAFNNLTKPVGNFYKTRDEAIKMVGANSTIVEDSGRGFRKVVASPKPIGFVSMNAIIKASHRNNVLIVGGGGGIPTIIHNNEFIGVDGVIDKDFALELISEKLNADVFIILTAVSNVSINFNKPNQVDLKNTTAAQLEEYIRQDHFAKGSMLPKVQAAIEFIKNKPNGKVIIAKLDELEQALNGTKGTHITK